jgi:hypothetical protein
MTTTTIDITLDTTTRQMTTPMITFVRVSSVIVYDVLHRVDFFHQLTSVQDIRTRRLPKLSGSIIQNLGVVTIFNRPIISTVTAVPSPKA